MDSSANFNGLYRYWLFALTAIVVVALLLSSLAPPSKVDELHYILPYFYDYSIFSFPFQHYYIFSFLSLLPAYTGKVLFGWDGIGFFNCIICLSLLFYIVRGNLFHFLFIATCILLVPVNFIAEGPTGIMFCLTMLMTVRAYEEERMSPIKMGLLSAFTVLIKVSSVPVIIGIFLPLLIVRRISVRWCFIAALTTIFTIIVLSPEKYASGLNPFFPILTLESDIEAANRITGIDFDTYKRELTAAIKAADLALTSNPDTWLSAVKTIVFSITMYPVWLFLVIAGAFRGSIRRYEIYGLLISIVLCSFIFYPGLRYTTGQVLALNLLVLRRDPFFAKLRLSHLLFLTGTSALTVIYTWNFIAATTGVISREAFLMRAVGGYEVKSYYRSELAPRGKIFDFCFRDKFYYGENLIRFPVAPSERKSFSDAEKLFEFLKRHTDALYVCSPYSYNHPGFTLQKRFEETSIFGTRNPFGSPQRGGPLYIYRINRL